jgi:hypothetical protein
MENAPERKYKILGGNVVLCGGTLGQAVLQGKGVGQPV